MTDGAIELTQPARNFLRMARRYGIGLIAVETDGEIRLVTREGGGRELWDEFVKAFKQNEVEVTAVLWTVQKGKIKV